MRAGVTNWDFCFLSQHLPIPCQAGGPREDVFEIQVVERSGIVPPALPVITRSPASGWARAHWPFKVSGHLVSEGTSGEPLSHPPQAQACPPPPNSCVSRAQSTLRCRQTGVRPSRCSG